jgi:thiamine biosynthesis lipoprotein ApbE
VNGKGVNRKRSLVVFLVLLVLGLLTLMGYYLLYLPYLEAVNTSTQRSMRLMDTVVDVRVDGRHSERLVAEAFATMEGLEKTLSRFMEESEIAAINRGAGQWVQVSPITLEVIELGL